MLKCQLRCAPLGISSWYLSFYKLLLGDSQHLISQQEWLNSCRQLIIYSTSALPVCQGDKIYPPIQTWLTGTPSGVGHTPALVARALLQPGNATVELQQFFQNIIRVSISDTAELLKLWTLRNLPPQKIHSILYHFHFWFVIILIALLLSPVVCLHSDLLQVMNSSMPVV